MEQLPSRGYIDKPLDVYLFYYNIVATAVTESSGHCNCFFHISIFGKLRSDIRRKSIKSIKRRCLR